VELKSLVELLYTAHQRFTSLQVSWRYHYDLQGMQIAEQRWVDMNPPGSVAMLSSLVAPATHSTYVLKRLWWQKPDCWREEQQSGENQHSTTTILCRGEWWSFSSGEDTVYTNTAPAEKHIRSGMRIEKGHPPDLQQLIMGVPLLDPSFLLTSHALKIVSVHEHAGREVVQVSAVYEKRQEYLYEPFFWATADEYQLLIDAEYGILLRYAATLDGREYAVSSVEHIVFNAPIPPEIFVLGPSW
jgi:hypothetical protein